MFHRQDTNEETKTDRLTGIRFEQTAGAAEVLRVLYDGNLGHANDDGVRVHVRGRGCVRAVGHMMKRARRVIVITDD